jgi:hypothetical protein
MDICLDSTIVFHEMEKRKMMSSVPNPKTKMTKKKRKEKQRKKRKKKLKEKIDFMSEDQGFLSQDNDARLLYNELLEIGRKQIKGEIDNDLEEHILTSEKDREELYQLNKYVYTYYSTNENDKTYTIDFLILGDYFDELVENLREKNLWYVAINFQIPDSKLLIHIDNSKNDERYLVQTTVLDENEFNRIIFRPLRGPESQDESLWIDVYPDKATFPKLIERNAYIHYLNSEYIQDEFISEGEFKSIQTVYEMLNEQPYINENISSALVPRLARVFVEDPRVDSKTLYRTLLLILSKMFSNKPTKKEKKKSKTKKRQQKKKQRSKNSAYSRP